MFDRVLYILLLLVIVLHIKHIYEIMKYNEISELRDSNLSNISNTLNSTIISYDPLRIPYLFNYTTTILKDRNKYYTNNSELIRISDFDTNSCIFKNNLLFNDLNIDSDITNIINHLTNVFSCNINKTATIIKGQYITNKIRQIHNLSIIGCLEGKCNILLINPKHSNEIKDKDRMELYKWSIIYPLNSNEIIYIPRNWYYTLECDNYCELFHIESDNIFTILFNLFS